MSEALVPAAATTSAVTDRGGGGFTLPQVIVDAGPEAVARFLEFFAGRIANERTRAAYGRAVEQFLAWCEARGLGLGSVSPLHAAAYIRTHPGSVPTVKQHLAAIHMLCDWLVVNQVLPVNPAAAVSRGSSGATRRLPIKRITLWSKDERRALTSVRRSRRAASHSTRRRYSAESETVASRLRSIPTRFTCAFSISPSGFRISPRLAVAWTLAATPCSGIRST